MSLFFGRFAWLVWRPNFAHVRRFFNLQSFSAQTKQSWVGRTSTSVEVSRWMRLSEMKSFETRLGLSSILMAGQPTPPVAHSPPEIKHE